MLAENISEWSKSVNTALLSWPQAFKSTSAVCGGKAWNLARLHHFGFRTPRGGVVPCDLYRTVIATESVSKLIVQVGALPAAEFTVNRNPLLGELRAAILATSLSNAFRQSLGDFLRQEGLVDRPVAVRSSATQEDSETTSFAGIHDSVLNVSGQDSIEAAILICFASLWSGRALSYRRKMNVDDQQIACAVVITEMVDAKSAGVAFTCDPTSGRRDVVTINANFGLGESVVSGTVEPDQYRVTRFSNQIVDQHIGRKGQTCHPKPGDGTIWTATENQTSTCLREPQIKALARLCERVFHALGQGERHQDIEWAHDGNEFVLLQARPVTALPKITCAGLRNQPELWSNGNFRDALPMVTSRAMSEFSEHYINDILRRNFDGLYHLDPALRFVRQFQGRFYCNASLLQWLWFDAVGFAPEKTNISLGGHQAAIRIETEYVGGLRTKMRRLWCGLKFFRTLGRYRKRANDIITAETRFSEQHRQLNYETLSDQALIDIINRLNQRLTDYSRPFIMFTSQSGALLMLTQTLEKYVGERAYSVANGLMTGHSGTTSGGHGRRLRDLALQLKNDPLAQQIVMSDPFRPRDWQTQLPDRAPFKIAFAEFIEQFGHRAVYEIDLSRPRWRENPEFLFLYIKRSLDQPCTSMSSVDASRQHETAWTEVRHAVPAYLHGYVRSQIAAAARGAELKEIGKSTYVRLMEPMRLALLEIGSRLTNRGAIDCTDDVFHCALCEVEAALLNEPDGRALKELIAARKLELSTLEKLPAVDVIVDDTPHSVGSTASFSTQGLRGMAVAPGVVRGIARLIRTPDEGHRLQPQDVLVAPSTDPAWTPLFLNASAIVMETGGYLSHGSIVAREYGIPAVVNVAGVMNAIRDGEAIQVDGNAGRVMVG